jgi:hypothetical protein
MTWLRRLLRHAEMEDQLDRELRFHLERHTADLIARGIAPDDARRQARLELGGPSRSRSNAGTRAGPAGSTTCGRTVATRSALFAAGPALPPSRC